jgi:hypothetical protein
MRHESSFPEVIHPDAEEISTYMCWVERKVVIIA